MGLYLVIPLNLNETWASQHGRSWNPVGILSAHCKCNDKLETGYKYTKDVGNMNAPPAK